MHLTNFQKISLAISGMTALAIGGSILLVPHAFYHSYGIVLEDNPNLLSELRAPGAGLVAFGFIMLSGVVRAGMASLSFAVALAIYLAFPAGRLLSILIDGIPSTSILAAMAIEVSIACLLLRAFGTGSAKRSESQNLAEFTR